MRAILSLLLVFFLTGNVWADLDTLRKDASAAATTGDNESAITLYREIVDQAPDDGAAHFQLGSMVMDNGGDLDEAALHLERAAELQFQPVRIAYRLSRIYARTGRESDALSQLEMMADGGFGFPNLVEGNDDYESISDEPRYAAALATFRGARFPCNADERHHAFDFWIGEWDVTQNGQVAGSNSIQPILGHCAIFEQWSSASGGQGKSFNYYDPGHDHWRQIWIGDGGTFIEFTGKARDGGIFYTAETIDPASREATQHKFEFTQNGDGSVRQFWATSTDAGETWATIWDGHYEKSTE